MELAPMGNAIADSASAPGVRENGMEGGPPISSGGETSVFTLPGRTQAAGPRQALSEGPRPKPPPPPVAPRGSAVKYDSATNASKITLTAKQTNKESRQKLNLDPNYFDFDAINIQNASTFNETKAVLVQVKDGVDKMVVDTKNLNLKAATKSRANQDGKAIVKPQNIELDKVALSNLKNLQRVDLPQEEIKMTLLEKRGNTATKLVIDTFDDGGVTESSSLISKDKSDDGGKVVIVPIKNGAGKGGFVAVSHGTPGGYSQGSGSTPGLDDGYGSSNSSPHSSGRHKPSKHGSANTLLFHKKEMLVQVDEDVVQTMVLSGESPQSLEGCQEPLVPGGAAATRSASQATLQLKTPGKEDDGRETWGTGADFLLSIIGFAVDLANVWRFPYLCYKNGGGAFLIPYTLMLIFGAVPLFYMELILGQFNRQGPISLWKICPLFKGVGFCAVMVAFYVSFYYNVIIGWSLYFLVSSATTTELPWINCNNTWNSAGCWDQGRGSQADNSSNPGPLSQYTPASEFFHRNVLEVQKSDGLHDLGFPKWQLVLCLLAVYSMLYLSLFKGVKSSGKVVWATATLPYVVLSLLLVRGLMLPGAMQGIAYYLHPQLSRLKETQVWVDAAVQIFYSVGAGFGVHLSYASYNTFHNNCYRDCLVTTAVNCFTSFFSGFVIFTYLGFMSHKQGVHISSVATEGPGLVFQVYPEAVATLPGASIWAMLFFFMLIMLGLDSGMGGLECVITGLMDEFHWLFKGVKHAREKFTFCAVGFSFCVACFNVTPGGIYMFHLLDTYSAGISLLCSALFEAVAVSWFYGLDKFSQDVEAMLGFKPGLYWRICWKFISPIFIIGVVTFALLDHTPLSYQDYSYPWWAQWIGRCLALSSVLMIPALALYRICVTPGTCKERIALSISPVEEHEDIKRKKAVSRFTWKHWLYV